MEGWNSDNRTFWSIQMTTFIFNPLDFDIHTWQVKTKIVARKSHCLLLNQCHISKFLETYTNLKFQILTFNKTTNTQDLFLQMENGNTVIHTFAYIQLIIFHLQCTGFSNLHIASQNWTSGWERSFYFVQSVSLSQILGDKHKSQISNFHIQKKRQIHSDLFLQMENWNTDNHTFACMLWTSFHLQCTGSSNVHIASQNSTNGWEKSFSLLNQCHISKLFETCTNLKFQILTFKKWQIHSHLLV